jgi:hypothetical protein
MSKAKTQNFSGRSGGSMAQLRGGNLSGSVASGHSGQNQENPAELVDQMPGNNDHIQIETFPDFPKV